jgi:hypothetical protein
VRESLHRLATGGYGLATGGYLHRLATGGYGLATGGYGLKSPIRRITCTKETKSLG